MGYIYKISINNGTNYLIEPLLFATASGTSSALTAGITGFTLATGAYVNIKVGQVDANATLSIIYGDNTATAPKPIYYNGYAINAGVLTENNIYTFIYDGTNWNVLGDVTGQNIIIGTTNEWGNHYSFRAPAGTILIYTDYTTINVNVNDNIVSKKIPAFKIGDGSTPIIDLPFVGDDIRKTLNEHIENNVQHVSDNDRLKWNNKITCDNTVQNNNLILTRN